MPVAAVKAPIQVDHTQVSNYRNCGPYRGLNGTVPINANRYRVFTRASPAYSSEMALFPPTASMRLRTHSNISDF